jgi:hypothetical protein
MKSWRLFALASAATLQASAARTTVSRSSEPKIFG